MVKTSHEWPLGATLLNTFPLLLLPFTLCAICHRLMIVAESCHFRLS